MDKFTGRKMLCDNLDSKCRTAIMVDITILGDTPQEIKTNIELFFASGGRKIQFIDGTYIKSDKPKIVKQNEIQNEIQN